MTQHLRWRKKIKKRWEEKILSWVAEKNTLLKKMLAALPCAFFKRVFFCGLAFLMLLFF